MAAPIHSQRSHSIGGIPGTILHFRFLVVVFAAVLMVFGTIQLRHMPVDVLPEFSPPHVEIQTEALGLSAEEVEQLITVPLEHNLLNGVAWLDKIRSESVSGLSSVTLIFEPGTDLYRARQMVAERLAQGAPTLPRVSKGPVMLQPKSATSRVLIVRLSSKTLSAIQMSVLARWTITPHLMGVPGVANVATWGMRDRQLQVQVDPDRLRAYQIPLLQVLESVGNALWVSSLSFVEAATPGNAGFIDTPQQRLGIQHISPIVSPESLSQVSVQAPLTFQLNQPDRNRSPASMPVQGGAVRVIDVADVVENHQPLIGDALSGDGANLLLVIEKFPGSDTVKVTRGVEAALASLRPGLGGMEIDSTIFRPGTFIETARVNLKRGALIACVGVLTIGFFFFNGRATLITFITIPLSLLAAALVLYLRGATLNTMVLTGLVLAMGIIVNDVIVMVENVLRRLRSDSRGGMPRSSASVIFESLVETRGGMLFASLICLLAVLPVFSLQETSGAFFQPLAVSYVLAVLASMFVTPIIAPALSAILLPNISDASLERGLIRRLQAGYDRLLQRMISRPRAAWLIVAVLAGVGLGLIPLLRPALLPTFKERDLLIHLKAAPGTSLPEMNRVANRVTSELRAIPGIRNASALVGRAVFGDRVVAVNSAEILVNVAQVAEYDATLKAIHAAINGYPGIECDVQTYLKQISSQVVGEASAPIIVRIYGQDWSILRSKAEELRQDLSGIAGIGNSQVSLPVEEPTLEVEVDLAAAQRHGINPGNVRRTASTLLNGIQVGSLFQEQKVFDVVVWSAPKARGNLAAVHNLLLDTPFEVPVRLGEVAQARIVPRPSVIRHEDVSRYVDLSLDAKGRNARSVADDIQSRLRQFQFPLEYHAKVFGAYERQQAARNRLLAFTAITLIGILLLLQAAYESWRLAILSFLTLPLALVGGLVAVAAAQNVSLGAVVGLLTVFGMAARNQILLIRRVRQLEREQMKPSGLELILQGARERFASTLMTALTVGLALLPLLVMGNIPGFEVLRPAALVILSGMVSGAMVDLLVVPALLSRLAMNPGHR
jgi:Cu/Ag efflux pump CusA